MTFSSHEFKIIENETVEYKARSMSQHNDIHIVNLCNWMMEYSKKSIAFSHRDHTIIPNSININTFKPHNKYYCRELLEIPSDKNVILFCSQSVANQRKGFDILLQSLNLISDDIFLAIVGNINNVNLLDNLEFKNFDSIRDELLMALLYSAADLFVLPSREDNLPNTMVESLSCGTPVVAFDNGGMKDILNNSKLGGLVHNQTPDALAEKINYMLKNINEYDSLMISSEAHKLFAPSVQASNYIALYENLLK